MFSQCFNLGGKGANCMCTYGSSSSKNMSHTYLVVVYFVFVVYRDRIAVAHLHLS